MATIREKLDALKLYRGDHDQAVHAALDLLNAYRSGLAAHQVYISKDDEAYFEQLMLDPFDVDVADFARRTCTCGARIEGFDGYYAHLMAAINAAFR
jgi:hypothetical protein